MNERIRLLAEQAGWDNHHAQFDTRIEKFAELIVRECADVSKNYAGGSMPLSIALAIKQHFGVER